MENIIYNTIQVYNKYKEKIRTPKDDFIKIISQLDSATILNIIFIIESTKNQEIECIELEKSSLTVYDSNLNELYGLTWTSADDYCYAKHEKEIKSCKKANKFKEDVCPICLLDDCIDLIETKCGHIYHKECLQKCIKNSKLLCPTCKTEHRYC